MNKMRRFTLPQIAAWGLALLIVNSAYLAAFAHASIFYEANVLLHVGLGLVLAAAAVRWARRYPRECGAFLCCVVPAAYIAIRGNTVQHRLRHPCCAHRPERCPGSERWYIPAT